MSEYIDIKLRVKFVIKNHENYKLCEDNNLYNVKTNRKIKQVRNGGSLGFVISGKFYSITFLKQNKMFIKPTKTKIPF